VNLQPAHQRAFCCISHLAEPDFSADLFLSLKTGTLSREAEEALIPHKEASTVTGSPSTSQRWQPKSRS
jgi:hypothetical protein